MAIAFDRCIQKTYSTTTTLARTQFQALPLNRGEAVVLRAEPSGLRDTGLSSQPLLVDDAKSPVTHQISASASPEIDASLLHDFYEFIEVREPGAYRVVIHFCFHPHSYSHIRARSSSR